MWNKQKSLENKGLLSRRKDFTIDLSYVRKSISPILDSLRFPVSSIILKTQNKTKKKLKVVKNFSKVAGYEINIQQSVAVLYTNTGLEEKEIKKTISLKIASKRINT